MAIELLLIHGSPYAWRVQLALQHKQLPHELRVLSLSRGDLSSPEFLALNPRGRVPVLRDGPLVIGESIAILAYLERRYPEHPLFGDTPADAASIWRRIAEYTAYLDAAVEAFILPLYFGRADDEADAIRAAVDTLTRELAGYAEALDRSPYLAGEAPTAADFVVYPHIKSVLRAAEKPGADQFALPFLPLDPSIDAWLRRVEQLPGYDRTYPPNWR